MFNERLLQLSFGALSFQFESFHFEVCFGPTVRGQDLICILGIKLNSIYCFALLLKKNTMHFKDSTFEIQKSGFPYLGV